MMSADTLLSPETRHSFGEYLIRFTPYLEPDMAMHDRANRIIYVRDHASAERLIAELNAAASRLRAEYDAALMASMGVAWDR
jgi:hypothetical protein